MTELTRRQMRELERKGEVAAPVAVVQEVPDVTEVAQASVAPSNVAVITSRRQLRESNPQLAQAPNPLQEAPAAQDLQLDVVPQAPREYELPEPVHPKRLAPVPPVGSRRALRAQPPIQAPLEPVALEAVEVEIPEDGFRGANYLGEPSTQSIMLEVAPEAIALPLDTGEVFTTGSIAILPEAPGPSTGGLDGAEVENIEEAVTGVLSIVDPVSAKTLIDERSPLGVVPEGVLRKGWWRPWLVGIVSLAMAVAAILASITILNALGE